LSDYEVFVVLETSVEVPSVITTILKNGENLELNHGHVVRDFRHSGSSLFDSDREWRGAQFAAPMVGVPVLWELSYSVRGSRIVARTGGEVTDDNSLATGSPVQSLEPFSVGGIGGFSDRFFSGYLGEIVVYDRLLDSAQRAAMVSYLTTKWDLPTGG
jgi:hypothetical protein